MLRNSTLRTIISVVTFGLCAFAANAQTSGWEDKGEYKEQKLRIPNLQSIAYSPDGKTFYSLHYNRTIYYWDMVTGAIIDTLIIPDNKITSRFSQDGRSLTYFTGFDQWNAKAFTKVGIYDLETKQRISKSTIKFTENFDCDVSQDEPDLWWHPTKFNHQELPFLSYNSDTKLLDCSIIFDYNFEVTDVMSSTHSRTTTYGGAAIMDVLPDTLLINFKYSRYPMNDLIRISNYDYYTALSSVGDGAATSGSSYGSYNCHYKLNKKNLQSGDIISLKNRDYSKNYTWSAQLGSTNSESGINIPFTTLFHDSTNNRLFMKADSIYYIFDLATDKQIDSIALPTKNGFEVYNKDYSGVFYYHNNKIYSQSIKYKTLVDSVECPFVPNLLSFVPNSEELLATSDSGRIIIFKDFKFSDKLIPVWVDKGAYKEDAIRIPGLQSIAYSPDGKTFYTLHNNKTVYYWNLATGALIDTLIIPDNKITSRFSKDGKTLLYNSDFEIDKYNIYTTVSIYELTSKQRIVKSLITMPGVVDCDLSPYATELWHYPARFYNAGFRFVDYNSETFEFYCGAAFEYRHYLSEDNSRTKTIYFGGAAQLKIDSDTANRDYQYSLYPVNDVLRINEYDYITGFYLIGEDYVYTGYSYGDFYHTTQLIKKNRLTGDSTEIMNRRGISSYYWTEHTGYEGSENGFNSSFTELLHDTINNRLFIKADSAYFIIDLTTDKQIDSLRLPTKKGLELFNKKFSKVIYYFNGKIYSQSVPNGNLIDSLDCPFIPNSISLVPNSEDVALTSDSGRIIIFKRFNSIPSRPAASAEIFLRPNPASDELFLPLDNGLIGSTIEIYTPAGEKVLETTYSERIEISSLPAGVYFLRAGRRIGKFIKI